MSRASNAVPPLPVPEIRRSRPTERFAIFLTGSLSISYDKMLRQFIELGEVLGVDFLGVGRVLETKITHCDLAAALPVPDLDAVLWPLVNLFGGNDIAA